MDPEREYVLALLARPGEDGAQVLTRAFDPYVSPEEISNRQRRKLLMFIQDNAMRDLPTSVRMAEQYLELSRGALAEMVEGNDPSGIRLYAEMLIEGALDKSIRDKAGLIAASELPAEEKLDQLQRELAQIRQSKEDDRIATGEENMARFLLWMNRHQADIRSGKPRVAFPEPEFARLNEMVPYLFAGNMVLVTAQTKVGKSAFAQQWNDYLLKRGFHTVCFHFEDTPEMMGLRRAVREMGWQCYDRAAKVHHGIPAERILAGVMTDQELELVKEVADSCTWVANGKEVYCVDWQMQAVARTLHRLHLQQPVDVVFVDYLNKAHITPNDMRYMGVYEARARDAEIIKNTCEQLGIIGVLVQQEGDDGTPFQTRQASHKAQVYLSLQRERVGDDEELDRVGRVVVKNANLGRTGAVRAEFFTEWLMWGQA